MYHHRHGVHRRKTQIKNPYPAVNAPMTASSGNHATNPRPMSQLRSNPKKIAPHPKLSMVAVEAFSTLRMARKKGTGAMNANGPKPIGGNAAHMSRLLAATRAMGTMGKQDRTGKAYAVGPWRQALGVCLLSLAWMIWQ
jgi:hypothetical protein